MPAPTPRWWTGLFPTAKPLILWIISITVVALVSAAAASHFTRQDNLELAFKQQQLSDIQRFQASASTLDTSLRAFNDALVDKRGVVAARESMRAAIAQHSSDTLNSERLFGEPTSRYNAHLGLLRDKLDAAINPLTAMPMAQQAIDLIGERQTMVKHAMGQIERAK